MKKFIAILASCAVLSGAAFANCGKKVNSEGTLAKYDKDTKTIVMEPASKETKPLTITAKTKITGEDGKKAKIEDLVGKEGIVVISEHGKIDSVAFKAEEQEEEEEN